MCDIVHSDQFSADLTTLGLRSPQLIEASSEAVGDQDSNSKSYKSRPAQVRIIIIYFIAIYKIHSKNIHCIGILLVHIHIIHIRIHIIYSYVIFESEHRMSLLLIIHGLQSNYFYQFILE